MYWEKTLTYASETWILTKRDRKQNKYLNMDVDSVDV
jgi:hypothetical protein